MQRIFLNVLIFRLCELCTGRTGTRCTLGDPYAGFTGALRCLLEAGDIAFLKHSTVPHVLSVHSEFSEFFVKKNLKNNIVY